MKYKKSEEKFYKEHKQQIIDGLKGYIPKNRIKRTFFGSVHEEQDVNNISLQAAMKKVLRSRTFTSKEENYRLYTQDVIKTALKGQARDVKKYLKSGRVKITDLIWTNENDGWTARGEKGLFVQIKKNPDTKTEGYIIKYGQDMGV